MRGPLALVVVLSSLLALPRTAAAWTDATVRTARAEIELTPDGRAHVTMWARVRVDGGWLEGLELEGLDADAELDPERPLVFRDATGVVLPAQVTPREDGRVSLRFTRRMAPRRGEYDIELAWTTALAGSRAREGGEVLEARWVFPAWRYGLDGVEIRWLVPEGTAPQPEEEITAPIETELGRAPERGELGTITYRRAHLPRTSDWETLVLVPARAWPHALETRTERSPPTAAGDAEPTALAPDELATPPQAAPEDPSREANGAACALALLLAFGGWLKRSDLERRARRVRREARFLVPAPAWASSLASAALAVAALVAQLVALDVAVLVGLAGLVVAVGWQRSTQGPARPRLSSLAPVPASEVRRARRDAVLEWVTPAAWLEPTRLGPVSAALVTGAALELDGSERALAALFVALVASGSRVRLGATPASALRALSRALEGLRVELAAPHVSVRLLGRGATDPTDLRVHVSLAHAGAPPPALDGVRIELDTDEREPEAVSLSITAPWGTSAELALTGWAREEGLALRELGRRVGARRALRDRDAGAELAHALRGLLAHAPCEAAATLPDEALAAE